MYRTEPYGFVGGPGGTGDKPHDAHPLWGAVWPTRERAEDAARQAGYEPGTSGQNVCTINEADADDIEWAKEHGKIN